MYGIGPFSSRAPRPSRVGVCKSAIKQFTFEMSTRHLAKVRHTLVSIVHIARGDRTARTLQRKLDKRFRHNIQNQIQHQAKTFRFHLDAHFIIDRNACMNKQESRACQFASSSIDRCAISYNISCFLNTYRFLPFEN